MSDVPDDSRERMIMEHLPRAVPSDWQLKLLDSDASTVEAYVRRLERLQTSEQLQREMQEERTRSAVPVRSVGEPGRNQGQRGLCFRCGRRGHFAAACRGPPLSASASESRQGAGPSEPRQGIGPGGLRQGAGPSEPRQGTGPSGPRQRAGLGLCFL